MMKAAVYETYGPPDVVQIKQVPKPAPKPGELLVKIHATTVNSGDWRLRSLDVPRGYGVLVRLFMGIFRPRNKILGMEGAGVVEAVGDRVTRFKPGDRVFAAGFFGFHAEYRVMAEDSPITHMPDGMSFEEAAAIPFGGETALYFLCDKAKVKRGDRVLINGASGAVGIAAIQIAKHAGAEVTAVCSAANAELVKSFGADHVIDYSCEDFAARGETWDIIMDNASTAPWARSKSALAPDGRLLVIAGSLWSEIQAPFVSSKPGKGDGKRVMSGTAKGSAEKLTHLAALYAAGNYKPYVERAYPFKDIAKAHAHVDTGRKKGSVVVVLE